MVLTFPPHAPARLVKILFLLALTQLTGCFSGQAETVEEPEVFLESSNFGISSLHPPGTCPISACQGENCASSGCHDLQSGNIAFPIAGSVFDFQNLNNPLINSTAQIEFYTSPTGSTPVASLGVDAYGNFYSTEASDSFVFPALRYQDGEGNERRVFMPRPSAPVTSSSCNFCHQLTAPVTDTDPDPPNPDLDLLPTFEQPRFLRISTRLMSNNNADLDYHGTGDPGDNCLSSSCHGPGGGATQFTVAGIVKYDADPTDADPLEPYPFADAAILLFPEPCHNPDDPNTDPPPDPELVGCLGLKEQTKLPKTYVSINSRGHFYTTQPIDWVSYETYPSLANYIGISVPKLVKHMKSAASGANAGNCYACHDGQNPIDFTPTPPQ